MNQPIQNNANQRPPPSLNKNLSNYLASYIDKYAEPEAKQAKVFNFQNTYQHVLVVPAYAESPNFLTALLPFCQSNHCLLIVVINQPTSLIKCEENAVMWRYLCENFQQKQQQNNIYLFHVDQVNSEQIYAEQVNPEHDFSFLVIDRFSEGNSIDEKQGVGLARKIGCDIAATLIANNCVQTNWINTTDADTQLPGDYFSQTNQLENASAAVYRFDHAGSDSIIDEATQIYQQSLHYYVEGLRWAKSSYAFHTIGSCIAVSAKHYCQARGFPKRAGGEDFYLLNKLAKLGQVAELKGQPINIQSRRSQRAPFGTGPAVEKILALDSLQEFCTYDPRVFRELKQTLQHLAQWWATSSKMSEGDDDWFKLLSPASQNTCQQLSVQQLFIHLRKQCKNEQDAQSHIHQWFDGFRTLKFIHLLQSRFYPPIPLDQALQQADSLFTALENNNDNL